MPRRWFPRLESVSSTRECRALSSSDISEAATHEGSTTPGSGATPPLIWDSRSFLTGIGQGCHQQLCPVREPSWFGQFGAMSITEAPFYFIFNIQPGCWPVRRQRVPLQPSLQRGVRQGDEQQAMCILELVANRSTSAAPYWGCALLWLRESDSPLIAGDSLHACWIVLLLGDYVRKHRHVVGANQYMPMFQLRLKILRANNTASSSKRFMCHRLWGSDHSPKVSMPSHTAHRPPVDTSVVTTIRDVTKPRGNPPAEETLVARSQSFDVAAGDHDAKTARGPRRPRHSRFQPKLQRAHMFFSKLPSLKRHREDQMAAERVSPLLLVKHTPRYVRLTRGENALMHIHA